MNPELQERPFESARLTLAESEEREQASIFWAWLIQMFSAFIVGLFSGWWLL